MPDVIQFGRRLRARLFGPPVEEEVESELAFHLEMRTREYVEQGMDPAAARRAALARMGDLERARAACRAAGRGRDRDLLLAEWLADLAQDLAFALRQAAASPGFTLAAVLTLALGTGALTAVFGLVRGVVLKPLPFAEPGRLVRLWETTPRTDDFQVSVPNFLDWREQSRSFTGMAAFNREEITLGGAEPERVAGLTATPELLPLLGVAPGLGRGFAPEEGRPGNARVALLGHGLWRRRFGGDPGVLGKTLLLDGESFAVVGVLPPVPLPGFEADLWVPLVADPRMDRDDRVVDVVARLAPGATQETARAEMTALARRLERLHPESNHRWGVRLAGFQDWIVGPRWTRSALVLLGAVALLWLVACADVAGLLLARSAARRRELGVRAALGAGRGRIVRQLLTESTLLALPGSAAGLLLATGALAALRRLDPRIPRLAEVSVDSAVLGLALGAAVAAGLLCGLAAAAQAARADLQGSLLQGGRGGSDPRERRLRDALVVAQMALAMVLLAGAGLLGTSFLRLRAVDPGFDPDAVLSLHLPLAGAKYRDDSRGALVREIEEAVAALPGAVAVGASNVLPFSGFRPHNTISVEGRPRSEFLSASWRSVTPGFFRAMGIPLLRGRLLTAADGAPDTPPVVVISDAMARRFWPGGDPLGRRILWGGEGGDPLTIVGVVGDLVDVELDAGRQPVMFVPYDTLPWPAVALAVRAEGDPLRLAGAVRQAIRSRDPDLPVTGVEVLRRHVERSVAGPRFNALLLAVFAAAALGLAAVGVYGIVAFTVVRRTREFGVRLALGARRSTVLRMVLGRGLALALLGLGLGLGVALVLARGLAALLYGTRPTDVLPYAAVALLLAVVAGFASWLPARRASRISPRVALESE